MDNVILRCQAEKVLYRYFSNIFKHSRICCCFSYNFCDRDKEDKYILSALVADNNKKDMKLLEKHLSDIFKLELDGMYEGWLVYKGINTEKLEEIVTLGRFI